MNNKQRAFLLYFPCLILALIAFYRFEFHSVYQGIPANSLADGHYELISRKCIEAGLEYHYNPHYNNFLKNLETASFMVYFNGNISRIAVIKGSYFTWILGNKNCYAYLQKTVKENAEGKLTLSESTKVTKVPAKCHLQYTYEGVTYNDDMESSSLSINRSESQSYRIYKKDNQFLLYEIFSDDFTKLGCNATDRFMLNLKKVL